MQSEIHLVSGGKIRVNMSPVEAQQALSKTKADASGLVQIEEARGFHWLVNPALVTHVSGTGK